MAIPAITIANDNLLRCAVLGSANGSAIVCVNYYTPANNLSFVPNVVDLDAVNAEVIASWTAQVLPGLCDTYNLKSVTTTVYKSPYKTLVSPTPPRWKMNPFGSVTTAATGAGAIATDSLPDYNVYRVYKKTGRAGRSFRGFMNFSPIPESATTGQVFTAGFLGGAGNAMMGFVGGQLFKLVATKTMDPVMFRISEYLKDADPLVTPATPPWGLLFDAVQLNNRVGILRSRKMRAPSA